MSELEQLRGVALLLVGDNVVLEQSGGLADDRSGVANTQDTRFQLASVSKQFTAAAILLLAERGSLSVHDPVGNWIGNCPPSWDSMTIHHLLTHTAGLGHWFDHPEINLTEPMPPAEEIAIFQRKPLLFEPGTRWFYSSPGYMLLAQIVQSAGDKPYAQFLTDEIFGPLGMTATFAGNASDRPETATGYLNGQEEKSFELESVGMGAGDVWSITGDMAKWDAALMSRSLLSAQSWDDMLARQAVIDDPEARTGTAIADGYGYAWFTGTVSGLPVRLHHGDNAGFRALNAFIPDLAVRVIVMSNENATDLEQVAAEMLADLLPAR
jgi:CubicO group peptidase (beta-lactamase class C family)